MVNPGHLRTLGVLARAFAPISAHAVLLPSTMALGQVAKKAMQLLCS
jgi:hypothetical protein